MEIVVDNKKYLATLSLIGGVDTLHEFGKIYHVDLNSSDKKLGEMEFYFEFMESTLNLKIFKAIDDDSSNILFLVLRYFGFNNQALLIETKDLITGKKEFESFIDFHDFKFLNVDKSSKTGYGLYLFDEEDSFKNITAKMIKKEYKQNEFIFGINEFE